MERALEDDDNELRLTASAVGQKLLEDAPAVREILEKYVDVSLFNQLHQFKAQDYLIGPQIREALGQMTASDQDPAAKTLSDILAGLSLVYVDVPDCS